MLVLFLDAPMILDMPAFLVGHGFARALSHMMQVPMYEFAHQENHILAALRENGHVPTHPFYSYIFLVVLQNLF